MRNKLFASLLIVLFITGVMLLCVQRNWNNFERRMAKMTGDIDLSEVFNGELDDEISTVLSDQMMGRDEILNVYNKMKIGYYSAFASNDVNGIVDVDNIRILPDGYCIYNVYDDSYLQYEDTVKGKAYNFKQIAEKYPGVKTYIYHPTRLEETGLLDTAVSYSRANGFEDVFLYYLGETTTYKKLEINSIEEYEDYFFKADHHWNIRGAYKGYTDIIDMLKEDFDIEDVKDIVSQSKVDRVFYGYFGNLLGRATEGDQIEDYDLGIDPESYSYYVDGFKTSIQDWKDAYIENGDDDTSSGYDIYFGENKFERIFDFNQEDKPNLLIFADSYVNPIKEWLASHFNVTVILDMRSKPGDFDLDYYMETYDIDAVLMLEYYGNVYANGYFFIPVD